MQVPFAIVLIVVVAVMVMGTLLAAISRYKRCPSDRILVKFGKVGGDSSSKAIHGGATFVWPVIQGFKFLDLTPMTTNIDLRGALSKQNIRVNVPSTFTFGIGTTTELMANAAERLLSLTPNEIEETARDIIFGQLRATIATMDIEEINADREGFEAKVLENIEKELLKIGLRLINVNISDITDEAGYIEALGQNAAAEAINKAKVQVAEKTRDGEIGQANANREQRISVSNANAEAVTGENKAQAVEAEAHADLAERKAEADRRASAAQAVKEAAAKAEGYEAEKIAEKVRAERDMATQHANVVVPAEIHKKKVIIDAEADKDQQVLNGQAAGEARAAELAGEARGLLEILSSKAEGIKKIVQAAGGDADAAVRLLIVEQLPSLVQAQSEAISGIDFGKVVVYGDSSTPTDFLNGLTQALPQLHELANMTGIELPSLLGARVPAATKPDDSGAAAASKLPPTPPAN